MSTCFVAVALGAALLAAGPGVPPTPGAPPAPGAPLGTVRQQVRRAKADLASHASLPEYHESPFQPSEIVERIHALQSEQAWAELCRELAALPDDELELFEDTVRRPEHARHLPCASKLLGRVDAYWKASE